MQYPTIAQPQYGFAPTMPMMPSMSDMPPAMMASGGLVDAAKAVQSKGRGEDTMLVHMTPGEVGGLQALAKSQGGSLSVNPQTGLPEAGFLKNFLPTLLGLALTPIMGPVGAGMVVGGVETVRTGDLGKGLMAGLGAYGGASLGSALGTAGAAGTAAPITPAAAPVATAPTVVTPPPVTPAPAPPAFATPAYQAAAIDTGGVATQTLGAGNTLTSVQPSLTTNLTPSAAAPVGRPSYSDMGQGLKDLFNKPGSFTRLIGKAGSDADAKTGAQAVQATGLGGPLGAAKTFGAMAAPAVFAVPEYAPPAQEEEEKYEGPYKPTKRTVSYPGEDRRRRTSEFTYFSPSNPVPFAEGGNVGSMTAPEAQVYSQIANVQRLSGLPAIDISGFNVVPGIDRASLVYNPIEDEFGPVNQVEGDYGFQSLSSHIPQGGMPQTSIGPQPVRFFKPVTARPSFGWGYVDPKTDPDKYREKFEEYVPTGDVNMFLYDYDPYLGGYKPRPMDTSGNAKGGLIRQVSAPQLESGGFVLTKKAVDGLGKGDNKKGQEVASRGLGAIPIKGPGTGTSDSIKTTIDGKQPARVANGEAYVPKKQVAKHGGAKKFYALMKKAERRA